MFQGLVDGIGLITQQSRADVNEIKKSSRRGADLVRQLLVFARRDPAQPAPVDLNEIVTGVQSLLARTLSQAIELEVSLAANLPPVLADPASLEQVLLNLAVNARDAMEGHGQLTLETSLVWLDDRYAETRPGVAAGPFVRLMVTDDGCGMTQEVQARIFDPFFTTKAIGDGTGLGLATVYGIVIQLGGHIDVYSEPGRGTAFKLYLPLEPVAGGPAAAVPPQPLRSGFGQTIWLVEDEETLRRSTERLLRHHGYEVTVAADGPSAVALGQQRHFDLALVDMVMPGGLSGRDVVSRLRERDPHLPAVFVSGYSEAVMARHGALDTASVLLEKPFAAEDLLRLVAEALQGARLAG